MTTARYRSLFDVVRVPAGGRGEIVYSPVTRAAARVDSSDLRIAGVCPAFATLDEHASRLAGFAARSGGPSREQIRAALDRLVAAGALVSEAELERGLPRAASVTPPRVSDVAVATRARPGSLACALRGYAVDAARRGRDIALHVVDDSGEAEAEAATRAIAGAVARETGAVIAVLGVAERADLTRALARRGFDPALLDFALSARAYPVTVGTCHNVALLSLAGSMFAFADDDTAPPLRPPPGGAEAGVRFASSNELREGYFDEGEIDAPGASEPCDDAPCILEVHEELLGRAPGDVAGPVDVDLMATPLARRLAVPGARVVATQLGFRGDCASSSNLGLLREGGATRARLHVDEATYRRAYADRRVVRVTSRRLITDAPGCMSLTLGVDVRGVVAPSFPVMRNCDGVFGLTTTRTLAGGLMGHLPWTVHHAPPTTRTATLDADAARGFGLGDLVMLLIGAQRVAPRADDDGAGMRTLGAELVRVASLPRADFEEIVRVEALRSRGRDIAALEDLRRTCGDRPAIWAGDVARTIEIYAAAMTRPDLGWPADLVATFGVDGGRARFVEAVRGYGALLIAWPDLLTAARELRRSSAASA